jgi:hypothetical protein
MSLWTWKVNSIDIPHKHMSETRGLIESPQGITYHVDEQ